MEINNWQEIETLFHAALQRAGPERAAYLSQECSGNALLLREVESLITAFETEHSFMEQPALSLGMQVLVDVPSGSLVGQLISHYKIVRLLGRGGMGEVYLAEDCRLERHVALKFLTHNFLDDGRGKRYLAREAKAVALLEHPNICAVYGIEEADGQNFIVMQFVEGQTLDHLIDDDRLEVERILALAEQIASALSAAHARGIIHRDIKPQNIMVTASGGVKVLDFGLAKLIEEKPGVKGAGDNPSQVSQQGLIIGTLAYMSPEQLRAEELDYKSDIFSFGIVLDEMLRGKNCFKRASEAETISAILANDPPPLDALTHLIKRETARIALKCLKKNRDERYQSTDELLLDVRSLQKGDAIQSQARLTGFARRAVKRGSYAVAGLALIVVLLSLLAFQYFNHMRVRTLAILPFSNESGDAGAEYVSDGLTQSLSDKLSPLSKLSVKSPTMVSVYKNRKTDPLVAGRELKVEAVLVGKIIKEDDALFLNTRLLNTADDSTLWEGHVKIEMDEIPTTQNKIIGNVISNLPVSLSEDERKSLTRPQTEQPEAFRLYLLGQYYWKNRNEENIKKAVSLFNRATDIDPLYAQAHAGLANSLVMLPRTSFGAQSTRDVMAQARAAARQAILIDPLLSEAHTSLGIIAFTYDWDWREAESRFQLASHLKPDDAAPHYWYSNMLTAMGRFDEAVKESVIARELDPFSPAETLNVGSTFYNARLFDRATEYDRRLLDENPNNSRALYLQGLILLKQEKYDDAIQVFKKIENKIYRDAVLGYAYAKLGDRDDALGMIKELEELSKPENKLPMEKAIVYIGLNDKENAFKFLEEAYTEHFITVAYLKVEPIFDDLHSDRRFADLIRRINLNP
ncbi:MAG TPA: protein kinase [Pyrinomonadaceae bacterium]|jgi:serine/threonine protein kinase|nr:protein kinase [Pyrinomonadaceae bacterium]